MPIVLEPLFLHEHWTSAADYGLPVDAVKEAIAYCESKPPEIEEDFRREEALMEATGMNEPDYNLGGRYKVLSPQERARAAGPLWARRSRLTVAGAHILIYECFLPALNDA